MAKKRKRNRRRLGQTFLQHARSSHQSPTRLLRTHARIYNGWYRLFFTLTGYIPVEIKVARRSDPIAKAGTFFFFFSPRYYLLWLCQGPEKVVNSSETNSSETLHSSLRLLGNWLNNPKSAWLENSLEKPVLAICPIMLYELVLLVST